MPSNALSLSTGSRHETSGFGALDEVILRADSRGCHLVRLSPPERMAPLCAHLARQQATGPRAGRPWVAVPCPPDRSLWHEVGLRLGLGPLPSDAEVAAQRISAVLSDKGATVLGALSPRSSWDVGVAEALARLHTADKAGLVLLLLPPAAAAPAHWEESFELEASMSDEALGRWWSALCAEGLRQAQAAPLALEQLERGWARALLGAMAAPTPEDPGTAASHALSALGADEARLVRLLQRSARSWPVLQAGALGARGPAVLQRLLHLGVIEQGEGATVRAVEGLGAPAADAAESVQVARALTSVFARDPWAHERAARLLAEAGAIGEAEAAHTQAIRLADDTLASADLWASWSDIVEGLPAEERFGCYLRSAELALARGDTDSAQSWAERAVVLHPSEFCSLELAGRAALGRSDLVGADATLDQALEAAGTPEERSRALAGRAEVRYAQGRLDEASSVASEAQRLAPCAPSSLSARNTLGKLLLARGLWSEAEEHFAADAVLATRLEDRSAQLRARLNRAIAVMSSGRLHEARPMLEAVLADGEAQGDERAEAFALSNLAVLAMNRHDYGEALQLSERAIGIRRRMGERLGLARVIANLAELRLRLGMVDAAEQILSFGRRSLSRGAAPPRTAHFALISARIHLARGNTLLSARDLATAVAGAAGSSDGDMKSECHRVGARIALEDGDIERAQGEIDLAEQHPTSPCAQAELALLRALLLRASGQATLEAAQHAVTLARRAGDEEFLREAHTLAAQIALAEGRRDLARSHLNQAMALRDRVAEGLPSPLRATFLGRRDFVPLARAERELQEPASAAAPASDRPAPESKARAAGARSMAGEDPALRGLLDGVRKVARTDVTVLVLGESGTGKELIAEAIHDNSPRHDAPLVKVNCAALVESLLLSELFGHEKGAFTGAVARKRGRFELAEGGTLFLDEIGDISPATQVALLRVLQERTFERVGGTTAIRANVRVVAATHRDLRAMVERGEFRQDLYFRLAGITLHVPALRARLGDLPLLVKHLLQRVAEERGEAAKAVTPDGLALLARHRWPGNVRELENALRAASLFAETQAITAADLAEHVEALRPLAARPESAPASLRAPSVVPPSLPSSALPPSSIPPSAAPSGASNLTADNDEVDDEAGALSGESSGATETIYGELKAGKFGLFDLKRQLERDCIARALAETRGNITRAASILGMKRPRLSQLVKQYGLSAVSSEGS